MKNKLKTKKELKRIVEKARRTGKKVVTTNGVFDLLHPAHLKLLKKAKTLGDFLIILLNSDLSVKKYKGEKRPIVIQEQRAEMLACLPWVDYITLFDDNKPLGLIEYLKPDLLVKGGAFIPERLKEEIKLMERLGGKLITFPLEPGYSTTNIIQRILNLYQEK